MRFTLILIFGLALLLAVPVSATIINVPADQPTIQAGINSSVNGDTVLVQPGTYTENINYNGKNIVVASLFLTTADQSYILSTIIDGGSSGTVVTLASGESNEAVLIGFTIQHGSTSGSGGGILCNASDPSIRHNRIISNSALNNGGGIYCGNSTSASITGNLVFGNSATGNGGGISCSSNNAACTIDSNIVRGNLANSAAGIYCLYAPISMNHNTIIDNSAIQRGGGIYVGSSNPSTNNSIIWGNSANVEGAEIYVSSGTPVFEYCDIGGGIWPGTGNISCEPHFCDPGSENFQIDERSCCAGAGDGEVDIGAMGVGCGPKTIHVPADFAIIQGAIDFAFSGDTVLVQPGTYTENIIYGGKNIVVASLFMTTDDPVYIQSTIIDGGGSGSAVSLINNESNTAELIGFTIQNGSSTSRGGGIFCYSSDPLISHNMILDNYAEYGGGGICCDYYSAATLIGNVFLDNSAGSYGGGIFCRLLSNITIDGNIINGSSASNGGGIYFNGSAPTMNHNSVTGNFAADNGGGIYSYNSNPVVTNSIIWGNSADDSGNEIYHYGGGTSVYSYCDIGGEIWPGNGNISCDPMFCDADIGDFYLDATSCCVGAGEGGADIGALGANCGFAPVPTLSEWGILLLALLLIAGGTAAVIRKRRVTLAAE